MHFIIFLFILFAGGFQFKKVLGAGCKGGKAIGWQSEGTNQHGVAKYNVSDTNLLPCFLQASSTHDSSVAHLRHPSAVQKG
jgi:hypothetical protein